VSSRKVRTAQGISRVGAKNRSPLGSRRRPQPWQRQHVAVTASHFRGASHGSRPARPAARCGASTGSGGSLPVDERGDWVAAAVEKQPSTRIASCRSPAVATATRATSCRMFARISFRYARVRMWCRFRLQGSFGLTCALARVAVSSGCAGVAPYQREYLAKPCMDARFSEQGLAGEYQAKVIETTTGGGLPGDAPGGGCGCTQ
jgi:hypothetical protein